MFRNRLNIGMMLFILIIMNYRLTSNPIHEILGIFYVLFVIIHNYLNRNWYISLSKRSLSLIPLLSTITNVLLVLMMFLVTTTGILISQTIFPFFFTSSNNIWAHEWHIWSSNVAFILCAIHIGFHWNVLYKKLYRWLNLEEKKVYYIFIERIFSLLIVAYGVYASYAQHIGSKLRFEHVFIGWGSSSSLFDLVDYAAIMGFYVVIAHYVTKIHEKINSSPLSVQSMNKTKRSILHEPKKFYRRS